MKNKTLLTALAVVALGVSAQATTITFQENGSNLTIGPSATFGGLLAANASAGETLYAKNLGGTETGLGITSDSDHEINPNNFVQIKAINGFILDNLIFLSSVQGGESATIWYSLIQGALGVQIGTVTADGSFDIAPFGDGYIGVSAGTGNILLESVSGHVPDGASTMLLLGSALTGLGLLKRKLLA